MMLLLFQVLEGGYPLLQIFSFLLLEEAEDTAVYYCNPVLSAHRGAKCTKSNFRCLL